MLCGDRFSNFWGILAESGGDFAYTASSSGDLYIKLPQNISLRSQTWLQETLSQILRGGTHTVLYSVEKMVLQALRGKYEGLDQVFSTIINLLVNSMYHSGNSARYYIFF